MKAIRGWALFALIGLSSVSGCGDDSAEPADSSGNSSSTGAGQRRQAPGGAPPEVSESVEIRVIDLGAEPRSELTYDFESGQKETMVMDLVLSRTSEANGVEESLELPLTRIFLDVAVRQIEPSGLYRIGVEITSYEVLPEAGQDPKITSETRQAYQGLPGIAGIVVIDEHGVSQSVDLQLPAQATPQVRQMIDSIKQSLRQILIAFPEESIGVGGRWVVQSTGRFQGMGFEQVTTYTLHTAGEGQVRLSLDVSMETGRQTLRPGVELLNLQAKGTGFYNFGLDEMVPQSEMQVSWTMDVDELGTEQKMVVTTKMSTHRQ
ncbi:MAG: DUF6263 family protein [Planctomycetota bacterium]